MLKTPEKGKTPLESTLENLSRDDDDDQLGLISSLRKLFEKNKKVKSLERTLGEVSNKMQEFLSIMIIDIDPQKRVVELISAFESELTQLEKVVASQA